MSKSKKIPQEQIKSKVRRTQAKVSLIKGTGCSILTSLRNLREKVEEKSFQNRFILCDDGHIDNVLGS